MSFQCSGLSDEQTLLLAELPTVPEMMPLQRERVVSTAICANSVRNSLARADQGLSQALPTENAGQDLGTRLIQNYFGTVQHLQLCVDM